MTFLEAKAAYTKAREEERIELVKALNEHGYKAGTRGGSGRKDYTSGGRMAPYDLSNFKYIEADRGDERFFISLQPFDTDPSSRNLHFLSDRIGVCKYTGNYDPHFIYANMKVLNIDLPLTGDAYDDLFAAMEAM